MTSASHFLTVQRRLSALATLAGILAATAGSQAGAQTSTSPDEQARDLEQRMMPAERTILTHGILALPLIPGTVIPPEAVFGAGYVPGIPRLGIPALTETDASLGVAYASGLRKDGATAFPSATAMASTWNTDLVRQVGATIGDEARAKGFNVLLGGGINLVRDPRNGRNFEYYSEDPLLSGVLGGAAVSGTQSRHVISTVKHYALNGQETGRHVLSANIADSAARESDLLAFQLAIEQGRPGSVMCGYNRVNGAYACDNDYLLNQVLKQDWGYKGWVMSDWGAVHDVDHALAGLDQQSGAQIDPAIYFGDRLGASAAANPAYAARLSDMNRRILRSMIDVGVIQNPPVKGAIDFATHGRLARQVAEEGIVLLRNRRGVLPLSKSVRSIAVIGGYADTGVMSGGGSSQVAGEGGPAAVVPTGGDGPLAFFRSMNFHASSPLKAIRAEVPAATVTYADGTYVAEAVRLARAADVAIVFATQWTGEGFDVPDLSLPNGQDALIAAVAAANPNTIVVLETGGAVLMPWLNRTAGVLQAWYPGAQGGEAIADVLFGDVNPSGRLPVTFPASLAQLPRPAIPGWQTLNHSFNGAGNEGKTVVVDYDIEGADVGYRWYARKGAMPLFPFGYGLSYTTFSYGDLRLTGGETARASFSVTNTGSRVGKAVAQVYLRQGPDGLGQRLIGWSKVELAPGETKIVSIEADPRLLARWQDRQSGWSVDGGDYRIAVGSSAQDLPLTGAVTLTKRRFRP